MFFFKQNPENEKTPVFSEFYIPSTNFNMDPKEFAKKKEKIYSVISNSSVSKKRKRSESSSKSKSNRSDSRFESRSISNSSKSGKDSETNSDISVKKIKRPNQNPSITKNFLDKFKNGNDEKKIVKKKKK